jgi:glyoxylase-like metal-dependent hydrolase (beta-lactamase superfamily II)
VQVVDLRAPARLAAGRIEIVPRERFHNIAGSRLMATTDAGELGLPRDVPVTVVCSRGNDSKSVALHLGRLGYEARSLRGGMLEWMRTLVPRALNAPPSLDRLVQFDRPGTGALGYLLVSDGDALVVDPPRFVEPYLTAARESGARIVAVADTHVHADYVSGAPSLSRELDVPYYLHPSDAVYPDDGTPGRLRFEPLAEGSTIPVGRCTVRAAHTPGHTEGSLTYLVDEAVALTGDFLFVASVGRPDLAGKTAEWTGLLWRSIERARQEWPEDLMIYPAHYASEGERLPSHAVGRRFGDILWTNEPMGIGTEAAFTAWVNSKQTGFPEAYRRIKAINVGLEEVDESEADVLEAGKNECALG